MQGMISSLHLGTTLIFAVSQRWSLYLNRCMDVLAPDSLYALERHVPFSLKPILAELEGGAERGPNFTVIISRPATYAWQ